MSVEGNNNIILGTGAELPAQNGSNQIVLGTSASSLLIQGSLNYHVEDSLITGNKNLGQPPAQFYKISPLDSTEFTITLPAANLNKGVTVIFRRTIFNMALVIFASGGNVYRVNSFDRNIALLNTSPYQFQTQFVCDGDAWYQIYAD
jgi:hypothetical protein